MRERFRLKDCAGEFLTRRQGEEIRKRLVQLHRQLQPDDSIIIDFTGVDTMTPSFADECFGKCAEVVGELDFRRLVSLVGADETIRTLINLVLSDRISPPDTVTT